MIVPFISPTGPLEIDTDKTYTVSATGVRGWMMAAIMNMLGNVGGTIVTLTEEDGAEVDDVSS